MTPPLTRMENGDAVSRDCAAFHLPPLDHDVQEHELCSYVDDLEKAVGAARDKNAPHCSTTLRPYAVEPERIP